MAFYFGRLSIKLGRYKFLNLHYASFHLSQIFQGPISIVMPSLSPTMNEGTIVKWHKKEGDEVTPGNLLCEIQTDKALLGFEVEEKGVLAKILKGDNSEGVQVGTLIALIAETGTDWKTVEIPKEHISSTSTPPPQSKSSMTEPFKIKSEMPVLYDHHSTVLGPVARNLIRQYGLNADHVSHTGPHGILTKSDVLKYLKERKLKTVDGSVGIFEFPVLPGYSQQQQQQQQQQPQQQKQSSLQKPQQKIKMTPQKSTKSTSFYPISSHNAYEDIPLDNNKVQYLNLFPQTKNMIPHSYYTTNCSLKVIEQLVNKFKADHMDINWLDISIKAIAIALETVPGMIGNNQNVNLLLNLQNKNAPISLLNLLNTSSFSVEKISQMIKNHKTSNDIDFQFSPSPSTVMLSYIEDSSLTFHYPIITPSSFCAVAMTTPNLSLANQLQVSVSCDSRYIDDVTGSRFLKEVKDLISNPSLIITRPKLFAR